MTTIATFRGQLRLRWGLIAMLLVACSGSRSDDVENGEGGKVHFTLSSDLCAFSSCQTGGPLAPASWFWLLLNDDDSGIYTSSASFVVTSDAPESATVAMHACECVRQGPFGRTLSTVGSAA